jgi:hypothetical protein
MNSNNISFVYVLLSLTAIVILSYLYFNKSKESFCVCHPIRDKRCPSPGVLTDLYNSGELTEYTDFAKKEGSPVPWKVAMPEDLFEMEQKSCN